MIRFTQIGPSAAREVAVRVEGVSKQYRIGARQRNHTLRETVAEAVRSPLRLLRSGTRLDLPTIWALREVSFDVKRGEVVGIIGGNGAGKSTLLKILSRITEPTSGTATLHGRVGSLLEVGTGFHPELTGRENVFLNGAILGMKRIEIERKFDEIVAFAEVDKFIDTPVKHYSSGMYVRLAFAVAAHLEPEILIVDEVLAVGDAAFQKKCLGKIGAVARGGRTVLFVSHNMPAVLALCDRVVLLEGGRNRAMGEPEAVIAEYLQAGVRHGEACWKDKPDAPGDDSIRLLSAKVADSSGRATDLVDMRMDFEIQIEYQIFRRVCGLQVGFLLLASDGTPVLTSGDTDALNGAVTEREAGYYVTRCTMPGRLLSPGTYSLSLGAHIPSVRTCYSVEGALALTVVRTHTFGGNGDDRRKGVICPLLPWNTAVLEAAPC